MKRFVQGRVGQRLPSERELTTTFSVSRSRLRGILDALEREDLIQRRQGSGTYVLAPGEAELNRVVLLVDAALKLGDDPFFSELIERLLHELQQVGAQCIIQRTAGTWGILPQCDGVIALGVATLESLNPVVLASQPVVGMLAAATSRPGRSLSLLGLNDKMAGMEAARHLVAEGVHRVYFFGRHKIPAVGERLAGVEQELKRVGLPLEVVECRLNYAAGLEEGARFKTLSKGARFKTLSNGEVPQEGPVGLIAANDWLALGLHAGLQSHAPMLRHRVQLISFDGLALSGRPELNIASLAVPLDAMVTDAVAELQHLKRPGAIGRTIRYGLTWRTPSATLEGPVTSNGVTR